MTKLDQVLQQVRNEIGGDFVSMSVVGSDGMTIAHETITNDPKAAEEMTSRSLMALQLAKKVSQKIGLSELEENLVTTDKAYGIFQYIGDGSYAVTLGVTRKATLGTVRMILDDYDSQIWDAIPR